MKVAQAEAQAIQLITGALGGTDHPAQYLLAQRYLESLVQIAQGANKTVFLPYEAAGVMSSLGGIKELIKDADLKAKV